MESVIFTPQCNKERIDPKATQQDVSMMTPDEVLPLIYDEAEATMTTLRSRTKLYGRMCAPEWILVYGLLCFDVLFVVLLILVSLH